MCAGLVILCVAAEAAGEVPVLTRPAFELKGVRLVRHVSFLKGGSLVATKEVGLRHSAELLIWDVRTGRLQAAVRDDTAEVIASSPDGKILATGGPKNVVRLWDTATWKVVARLEGHKAPVKGVYFLPKGEKLVSLSLDDATVITWDVKRKKVLRQLTVDPDDLWVCALSPDGTVFAAGARGDGNPVTLWDTVTGKKLRTFRSFSISYLSKIVFAPTGKVLACETNAESGAWNAMGDLLSRADAGEDGYVGRVQSFSPDCKTIVLAGGGETIRFWDYQANKITATLTGHREEVTVAVVSADGKRLASGDAKGDLIVWDVPRRRPLVRLRAHRKAILSAAFSPDGRFLVTGSWDGTALLWDLNKTAKE
jgi:WD40 repeat protein